MLACSCRQSVTQADVDRLSRLLTILLQSDHSLSALVHHESSFLQESPPAALTSESVGDVSGVDNTKLKQPLDWAGCGDILLDLIKFLRNLCAGVQDNQQMIV